MTAIRFFMHAACLPALAALFLLVGCDSTSRDAPPIKTSSNNGLLGAIANPWATSPSADSTSSATPPPASAAPAAGAAQNATPAAPTASPQETARAGLLARLHDPNPGTRREALERWTRDYPHLPDAANQLLHDPDESVRLRAHQLWNHALSRGRETEGG